MTAAPTRATIAAAPSRQRGWAGMLVILVALAIVGFLAKDALKSYLGSGGRPVAKAASPGERARAPGAVGIEAIDPGSAPSGDASALGRARGVEDMLKQQAAERERRGDGTSR